MRLENSGEDSAMKRQLILFLTTSLVLYSSAFADPAAVVKAQSEAYGAAFNACDVPAAVKLYENGATLIGVGDGEVGKGKKQIPKVLKLECTAAVKSSLKAISS
jgi:ketosteroid isomerase-like protein